VRRLALAVLVGSLAVVGLVTPAGAAPASLTQVTVTGDAGQKPTVTFSKPYSVKSSQHRQLVAGTGDKLVKGAKVTFDYVVVDGRTGAEIESTYGQSTPGVVLDVKQTVPGLVKGLVGKSVGGRELIAIAPKEGLARSVASQNPAVKKGDTMLFVVDVKEIREVLKRAKGTAVPAAAGLPTVKLASNGKPTIKVPKAAAPTELVVQPLIKGDGPAVVAGQTVTVQYTGVIWDTNKKFDSSWDRGSSTDFPIGVGQVIAGWDEGLVGQTVGSQVLLVVPPDKGYGSGGQPSGGIKGTDTLVFVVDILDAF
jgi:FKBP-type peptidyl-prolyl cis-trans isomerase